MRAMILAAGRGSRLGRLTESRPKPLIEISGKPILEHLLRNAADAGIRDYLVNIGYLGHMIQEYFGNGSRFGINVQYVKSEGKWPEQPIFVARKYIEEETFCCFCGDNILIPSQIERMIESHSKRNSDATFTLEQGESKTIKRVRIEGDRITGSSTNVRDPVLVYNMVMQTYFLDVLYETIKDREDKAFAFAMDELARKYMVHIIDIPFININLPEDILNAERILNGRGKNG